MSGCDTTGSGRLKRLAEMVCSARRVAVLTGAGMSTASGIPDFRSPTGLYAAAENEKVFDLDAFDANPALFYRFAQTFYPMVSKAQPNSAHRILAEWERKGKRIEIATQNIDDLHQRADSSRVYPVHGTILTSACRSCGKTVQSKALESDVLAGRVPRCACGGVFKPDITFFGEALPEAAWTHSIEAMSAADLVLVLGTSLAVYPAAYLPRNRPPSAQLVIINRNETDLDDEADLVFHESLADFFEAVAEFVH